MGNSSGGHQAMLLAMRPFDTRYGARPQPAGAPGGRHRALRDHVLAGDRSDGRYHYAKQLKAAGPPYPPLVDEVLPCHDAYWQTEEAMAEGCPALALERGESVELPPVLYLQGAEDVAHPRPHLDRFVAATGMRAGRSIWRCSTARGRASSCARRAHRRPIARSR